MIQKGSHFTTLIFTPVILFALAHRLPVFDVAMRSEVRNACKELDEATLLAIYHGFSAPHSDIHAAAWIGLVLGVPLSSGLPKPLRAITFFLWALLVFGTWGHTFP